MLRNKNTLLLTERVNYWINEQFLSLNCIVIDVPGLPPLIYFLKKLNFQFVILYIAVPSTQVLKESMFLFFS